MSESPEITTGSWIMVSTLGFIWGGTFIVQALALETAPPLWVAAGRIGFAAILTAAIWQMRGGRLFPDARSD